MPSGLLLSITAAPNLQAVYIYREILSIVKRFAGEMKRRQSGVHSAGDGLKHGSHRVRGKRQWVSCVRWASLPASFSTNFPRPPTETSSIASTTLGVRRPDRFHLREMYLKGSALFLSNRTSSLSEKLIGQSRQAFGFTIFYFGEAGTNAGTRIYLVRDYFLSSTGADALCEDHEWGPSY
jgi:hypothetical protein